MDALEIKAISKHFGGIAALRNVSLRLEPGTVTALVGDNGAGKSTLLKLLSGVEEIESGELVLGKSLNDLGPAERRTAGIETVYQDLALAPQLDIATNLFLGREICAFGGILRRREMRRVAFERLANLGVDVGDLRRPAGLLSGGQQQALAIARALLFDPRVLLLDEPTAALAARETARVLDLVARQKELGRIVIFVSHRLDDVFQVADRIVVLKRGEVAADEPRVTANLQDIVTKIIG